MDILEQFRELNRPVVEQKEWMEGVDLRLASRDDLDTILQECVTAGVFGLDLETTGLDQRAFLSDSGKAETRDKIVGYCIAPSTKKGWYIPVRHKDEGAQANVPPRLVVEMINKIQMGGARAVFHNAKFDQKFLEYEPAGEAGQWDNCVLWEDTLILAYLRNTRERNKGLKALSNRELGREMIELKELFPPEAVKAKKLDFSMLDPTWEPVIWYAAADAVNTLALYEILSPQVLEKGDHGESQRTVYKLEKACLRSTVWMEHCRVYIDRDRLMNLIRIGQEEWWACLNDVYEEAVQMLGRDVRPGWFKNMEGYDPTVIDPTYMESRELAARSSLPNDAPAIDKSVPKLSDPKVRETVSFPAIYDVTIPANLGLMLREMGVKGLVATEKSGQVKTSKDELERVIEGAQFPFMGKIKRFREVAKGLGTYLYPLYWDTADDRAPDGRVWANFNATKVDTGRFSTPSPGEKRKEFFHGQVRWNVHSTPATYDKAKPECVRRIRECIKARPGNILFAVDYSGVELRIVTNLSMEPKWLTEFFRCSSCDHAFEQGALPPPFCPHCGSDKIGDLHSLTALSVYGDGIKGTSEFKQRRQQSKALNFAMCYGGGGMAAQRAVGVGREEGWRIKNQFDATYKVLRRWWGKQHTLARRQKYVTTAYGRKYPLPDIDHEMGGFRSKAERNSVNGPVQGTSADIMKLAMVKLYREFKQRGWLDRALMTITIHDELVFEVEEELAGEVIEVIEDVMINQTITKLGWAVPLKVDVEFGDDWTVPFNLTEMRWNKGGGNWTPRWVRAFPLQYEQYLSCGGTPIEVEVNGKDTRVDLNVLSISPTPEEAAPTTLEKEGDSFVYRIPKTLMTPQNAERLARVVCRCIGKGMDTLYIRDEEGNDLLGCSVRVAYEEFRVIADYEGL